MKRRINSKKLIKRNKDTVSEHSFMVSFISSLIIVSRVASGHYAKSHIGVCSHRWRAYLKTRRPFIFLDTDRYKRLFTPQKRQGSVSNPGPCMGLHHRCHKFILDSCSYPLEFSKDFISFFDLFL